MVTNNKEYASEYYKQNKQTILEQTMMSKRRSRLKNMLYKLNNNLYKKIPIRLIEKNNLLIDNEGKYYLPNI